MPSSRASRLPVIALLLTVLSTSSALAADTDHWIGTWGASPNLFQAFGAAEPPAPLKNQTVREKLRISAGGDRIVVRFSNEMGTEPLVIGTATVARAGEGAAIDPASLFLTGVYVRTTAGVKVIAALGDSITDGTASTPHTYNSWPDQFAARVGGRIAVINEGIRCPRSDAYGLPRPARRTSSYARSGPAFAADRLRALLHR